jgi:tetratricopeptide (TPR) repeat protein
MATLTDSKQNGSQRDAISHATIWKRLLFFLGVAIYLLVGGFIYREWITSLRPSREEQAREVKDKTNEINYKYFTAVGLQYYQSQEFYKAEVAFRKALEYRPDEALAYNNLGGALNGQRKWDEAIPTLEKALSLDPTLAIAKNNLDYAKAEKSKMSK